jgi:hypothetical protein
MAITNPTPKARFQSRKNNIEAHRRLIEQDAFDSGVDFALMEYQRTLAQQSANFNDAAANHFKITGALEFLQTLRNLAEMATRPTIVDKDNLQQTN